MLIHLQSSTLTTKDVSHFHLKLCHDSGVSHILPFTLVNPTRIQTTNNYNYMSNYDFSVCFSQLVDLHYNCLTMVLAFSFFSPNLSKGSLRREETRCKIVYDFKPFITYFLSLCMYVCDIC
jgi:hypothetical protein